MTGCSDFREDKEDDDGKREETTSENDYYLYYLFDETVLKVHNHIEIEPCIPIPTTFSRLFKGRKWTVCKRTGQQIFSSPVLTY